MKKKRYSQYGSLAASIPGVIQVSKNTYVHAGFTIRKCPRNALNNSESYLINKRDDIEGIDNYYGRDFSLSDAKRTIDRMINNGRFISLG